MSNVKDGTRSSGHRDQQLEAGRDLYNLSSARQLQTYEHNGVLNDTHSSAKSNTESSNDLASSIRDKEGIGGGRSPRLAQNNQSRPPRIWRLLTSKKLRGKTSLITVILVLFGGAGAVTLLSSPTLAIVQLRQVLTNDLNDQLKSFENRHSFLLRSKLKTTTKGSCGVVKIACRFDTMSDRQVERFAKAGITIEREPGTSILPNRNRVSRITFPNPDGGSPIQVNSAEELTDRMRNDVRVRSGMVRAENPWFASMTDTTFKSALRILGSSKASRITGNTDEEREKSVNAVIGEKESLEARNLTPEVDKDNKPTGRLIGPDGSVMTQQQIDLINQSAQTAESASRIKPSNIASSIGKGVILTGAVDTGCSVFNAMRMVGALAKVDKAKQAAQMATSTLLVPADKIMAGDSNDGETEFVGNKINNIGGPKQPEKVVDESKLYDAGTDKNPPMKDNPNMYTTAFDSPGVKAAQYGDVIPLDSSQARFSLAGGFIGTLSKVNSFIAKVVTGGNPDPKAISDKCKYIQNPYVRGTALIAGIFVGIGSFGTFQAFSIAASLGVSMALPYAISMAADIASGDMFKNLYGRDFGSGSFVGTAAATSTAAQLRGMKPLSAKEAVAYTQSNQEALDQYASTQRYLAKSTPFDIYNQYSFMGSLAASITPSVSNARSSAGMMAFSITKLIPQTFGSLVRPAKAANTIARFQQCQDPGYISLGIGADIYCNVRYGLSDKELAMDPVENATWMASTGNIEADDETGEPVDNGQPWNYKKFMEECANRTVGYGEDQDENQGDGSNCVSSKNEALNQHFRIFTMDRGVQDYMDDKDTEVTPVGNSTGSVSADGWAYPTTKDAQITSGYKDSTRLAKGEDHRGIDFAQPGGALGKPIFAARDGKVVASGPADGFGNWIVIEHQIDGKTYSTVYGHMRAGDLMVRVGDTVKAGQQIARIGSEGNSSGPHLHFEIWNGNRLNPTCGNPQGDCSIDPTPIITKAKDSGNQVNL